MGRVHRQVGDTAEHILASVKVTEVIVEWVGQPPLQVTQSYSLTEKHSERILYNRFTNSKHPKQPIRKIQKQTPQPTQYQQLDGSLYVRDFVLNVLQGSELRKRVTSFCRRQASPPLLYHSHSHSLHCCQLDPQNALRLRSHNLWRHTLSSWRFPSNLMKILDHTA